MNYIKKLCCIIGILLFSNHFAYMQDVKYYIRFEDEKFIPIEYQQLKETEADYMKVKTGNEKFNLILSKYKIKNFSQAFPTAKSEWLQKVYIIESETALLDEIEKQEFRKEEISHIEPLCEPELLYTPNDYALAIHQTNLDLVNAKQAWDIIGNLPRIPIGVTDTYFDIYHEDLENQFIAVRGSNDNTTSLHGTAVAGILGAITNNGKGIASISLGAKMIASTRANDNEVLLLAQQGYRVINCSWYNTCFSSTVQDNLYQEIRDVWNTVVVFGAGNNVSHCGSLTAKVYPASYSSVLSVTSVNHKNPVGYMDPIYGGVEWKDCHEWINGSGDSHHHNDAVDICAPGYCVPTTILSNAGKYSSAIWGTSFAAPHVTAAICLILSINPCLTAAQAIDIVKNTADASIYSIPYNAPFIGLLGTGRLDVAAACLSAAQSATQIFSTPTILSGTQTIQTDYAIRTTAPVQLSSGANILFKTRKEVEINAEFEVPVGATFEINVDPNNSITCN